MPEQVVVNKWCDPCWRNDSRTPGERVFLALKGFRKMKSQGVLLCESHRKELIDPLHELLEEFGVDEGEGDASLTSSSKGEEECPVLTCDKTYKLITSLRNHCRDVHGATLAELRGEDPGKAPAVTEAICDVEGCIDPETGKPVTYTWPVSARPSTALGVHKRMTHGIKGKATD